MSSVYLIGVQGGIVVGSVVGGVIAGVWGVTAPFWFAFVGSAILVVLIWPQLHPHRPRRCRARHRGRRQECVVVTEDTETADLLVPGADLVVTMDGDRRELAGRLGGVPDGFVERRRAMPVTRHRRRRGCSGPTAAWSRRGWSTPTTTSTRTSPAATRRRSTARCSSGSPRCTRSGPCSTRRRSYLSAWVGLAELALGGCTTSTDHLYVHPPAAATCCRREIAAARELGLPLPPHPGFDVASEKDGGLPPDSVVQDDDTILADCERRGRPAPRPVAGAMVQDRAGALLAVLGHAGAHAADRRAGRAPRRAPAHPPGRGPRRGHATASRPTAAGRSSTSRTAAGGATARGWRTASTRPTPRSARHRAVGHRRGPLPELQHAHRRRRASPRCRRSGPPACRSASAATARRRPTARRCGWRPAAPCCWAACATVPPPFGARDALEMATLGSAACLGRHGRARRAGARRGRRPRGLEARRHPLRRGADRPGRGVAAVRPDRRPGTP